MLQGCNKRIGNITNTKESSGGVIKKKQREGVQLSNSLREKKHFQGSGNIKINLPAHSSDNSLDILSRSKKSGEYGFNNESSENCVIFLGCPPPFSSREKTLKRKWEL